MMTMKVKWTLTATRLSDTLKYKQQYVLKSIINNDQRPRTDYTYVTNNAVRKSGMNNFKDYA